MDFSLSAELEDYRLRVRAFVEKNVLPLEQDKSVFDAHENIREDIVATVRAKAKAEGLWHFKCQGHAVAKALV